jgi:hypothetical protein
MKNLRLPLNADFVTKMMLLHGNELLSKHPRLPIDDVVNDNYDGYQGGGNPA